MSTSLAVVQSEPDDDSLALTPVSDIQAAGIRLRSLQAFVSSLMKQGEDYGTIPGTKKPTLYKPGAEKLLELYGLAASYEVTHRVEEWERGFWAYEVKCVIRSRRRGDVVGEGVGSCNSYEEKYRWRNEYSNNAESRPPAGDGWKYASKNKSFWTRRVENENRWDLVNTILKMAKKRSLIDGALSVTRSSGLFTQDIEDMPAHLVSADEPAPLTTPRPHAAPAPAPRQEPTAERLLTGPEQAALASAVLKIGREQGYPDDAIYAWLKHYISAVLGKQTRAEMTPSERDELIDAAKVADMSPDAGLAPTDESEDAE